MPVVRTVHSSLRRRSALGGRLQPFSVDLVIPPWAGPSTSQQIARLERDAGVTEGAPSTNNTCQREDTIPVAEEGVRHSGRVMPSDVVVVTTSQPDPGCEGARGSAEDGETNSCA